MFFSKSYTPQALEALDPAELQDLMDHFSIRTYNATSRGWQILAQRISRAQSRARRVALPASAMETGSIEDMLG